MLIGFQNDQMFFCIRIGFLPGFVKPHALLDKLALNVIYERRRGPVPSAILRNGKDKRTCLSFSKNEINSKKRTHPTCPYLQSEK